MYYNWIYLFFYCKYSEITRNKIGNFTLLLYYEFLHILLLICVLFIFMYNFIIILNLFLYWAQICLAPHTLPPFLLYSVFFCRRLLLKSNLTLSVALGWSGLSLNLILSLLSFGFLLSTCGKYLLGLVPKILNYLWAFMPAILP